MWFLAGDGLLGEDYEMASISGDQAPALPRSMGELLPVGQLDISHIVSTECVDSPLAEAFSDPWGQVLVQVELHALRTMPGRRA